MAIAAGIVAFARAGHVSNHAGLRIYFSDQSIFISNKEVIMSANSDRSGSYHRLIGGAAITILTKIETTNAIASINIDVAGISIDLANYIIEAISKIDIAFAIGNYFVGL